MVLMLLELVLYVDLNVQALGLMQLCIPGTSSLKNAAATWHDTGVDKHKCIHKTVIHYCTVHLKPAVSHVTRPSTCRILGGVTGHKGACPV